MLFGQYATWRKAIELEPAARTIAQSDKGASLNLWTSKGAAAARVTQLRSTHCEGGITMAESNHNDTYTPNDQKMSDLVDSLLLSIDDTSEMYANVICPNLELGILRDPRKGVQDGSYKLSRIQKDVGEQATYMAKVLEDAIELAKCLQKEDPDIAPVVQRLKHALLLTSSNPTSAAIARSLSDVCALCAATEMLLVTRHPEYNALPCDPLVVFGSPYFEEDRYSPAEIAWCYAVKFVFSSLFETVKDPGPYMPYLLAHDAPNSGFDYAQEIEKLRENGYLPALGWAMYGIAAERYGDAVERLGFVDHVPRTSYLYASIPKYFQLACWSASEYSTVHVQVGAAVAKWMGKHAFAIVPAAGEMHIEIYAHENYLAKLQSLVGTRTEVWTDGSDPDYIAWQELANAERITPHGEVLYIPSALFIRAGFVSPSFVELEPSPDRMSLVISPRKPS